jgi:hypothetical protein
MTERQLTLTRASDIEPAGPGAIRAATVIRDTIRRVLPQEWAVLPGGCSSSSLLAREIMAALERSGLTVTHD